MALWGMRSSFLRFRRNCLMRKGYNTCFAHIIPYNQLYMQLFFAPVLDLLQSGVMVLSPYTAFLTLRFYVCLLNLQ